MTVETDARHKAASGEQIERIRQLSTVALGSPGAAFDKYGYPSTRGKASDIIRELDQSRRWGREDNEPEDLEEEAPTMETDTKQCTRCGQVKPLEDFYKNQGRCKPCFAAAAKERQASDPKRRPAKARKPEGADPVEEPVATNRDWRDAWQDPTLSQLRALQEALGAPSITAAIGVVERIRP